MESPVLGTPMHECPPAIRWDREHGEHCTCRLLAVAAGAPPSAVDYRYCRDVLQQRWRMTCDHIPPARAPVATVMLPPHDPHDPVQLILVANADRPKS